MRLDLQALETAAQAEQAYYAACDEKRREKSQEFFGHKGASIPETVPDPVKAREIFTTASGTKIVDGDGFVTLDKETAFVPESMVETTRQAARRALHWLKDWHCDNQREVIEELEQVL